MHQINPENLKEVKGGQEQIGEGVFGKCFKKMYQGKIVATKYFKPHTKVTDVEHEAEMIMGFDHPGNLCTYMYLYTYM
jgi:predicted Ser/Thr protein kinase